MSLFKILLIWPKILFPRKYILGELLANKAKFSSIIYFSSFSYSV